MPFSIDILEHIIIYTCCSIKFKLDFLSILWYQTCITGKRTSSSIILEQMVCLRTFFRRLWQPKKFTWPCCFTDECQLWQRSSYPTTTNESRRLWQRSRWSFKLGSEPATTTKIWMVLVSASTGWLKRWSLHSSDNQSRLFLSWTTWAIIQISVMDLYKIPYQPGATPGSRKYAWSIERQSKWLVEA